MQTSIHSSGEYAEICGKMSEDFTNKLQIDASQHKSQRAQHKIQSLDQKPLGLSHNSRPGFQSQEPEHKIRPLNQIDDHVAGYDREEEEEKEEEEEESEFTFACSKDCSPIAADQVFQDGQIRPFYPLFDTNFLFLYPNASQPETRGLRPPLKKLFMDNNQEHEHDALPSSPDELEGVPEETYCLWNGRTVEDAAPETCRKSNSTGFSKLWRFRDMERRSTSDGKDAFVFLNGKNDEEKEKTKKENESNNTIDDKKKKKKEEEESTSTKSTTNVKGKKMPSAHEQHYLKNRAMKEGGKRKSYLPYRQDLVGFFTNVNGLSKNVHPY